VKDASVSRSAAAPCRAPTQRGAAQASRAGGRRRRTSRRCSMTSWRTATPPRARCSRARSRRAPPRRARPRVGCCSQRPSCRRWRPSRARRARRAMRARPRARRRAGRRRAAPLAGGREGRARSLEAREVVRCVCVDVGVGARGRWVALHEQILLHQLNSFLFVFLLVVRGCDRLALTGHSFHSACTQTRPIGRLTRGQNLSFAVLTGPPMPQCPNAPMPRDRSFAVHLRAAPPA